MENVELSAILGNALEHQRQMLVEALKRAEAAEVWSRAWKAKAHQLKASEEALSLAAIGEYKRFKEVEARVKELETILNANEGVGKYISHNAADWIDRALKAEARAAALQEQLDASTKFIADMQREAGSREEKLEELARLILRHRSNKSYNLRQEIYRRAEELLKAPPAEE